MLKKSAGILVYKLENNTPKVLLCHFGGPFWEGIDKGGWSIPKGELSEDEDILSAAKREFKEETNLSINEDLKYLGSKKVSHRKLAIIFYTLSINKFSFISPNSKFNSISSYYMYTSREILFKNMTYW